MSCTTRSGRWVIVLDANDPPVLWSEDRASIENVCQVVRKTCPDARVVWRDVPREHAVPGQREREGGGA